MNDFMYICIVVCLIAFEIVDTKSFFEKKEYLIETK